MTRKPYPSDVSDDERAFVAPYLTLMKEAGIELIVVKMPEAKKGFVLLPRRWVVERRFAWTARFRRLARDFERLPETFRSLHFLAFAILMLQTFVKTIAHVL
jgi:hypothetical protein